MGFLINAILDHSKVASASRRGSSSVIDFVLKNDKKLAVCAVDVYVLAKADVVEALWLHENINCVITTSSWNHVSGEAAEHGAEQQVGVFTLKEFLGAINYNKYWLYEPMPMGLDITKTTAERRRRRKAWN